MASAQQQAASPVRAGLAATTRNAAAQRSRVARTQATAQRRHAPPEDLLAEAMVIEPAPRKAQKPRSPAKKRCSRQPRVACSRKTMQPDMLKAIRAAQQSQSRSQRAQALAQKRGHLSAAQDEDESATCSQPDDHAQQQAMQVTLGLQSAVHTCCSTLSHVLSISNSAILACHDSACPARQAQRPLSPPGMTGGVQGDAQYVLAR